MTISAAKTNTRGRGDREAALASIAPSPQFDEEERAKAKVIAKVLPELTAPARRGGGKPKSPVKEIISLRLDKDVIDVFKAGGPGWHGRINEALKRAVRRREATTPHE